MTQLTPEQIDAVLPQTQCGDCGYGGCKPYAKAWHVAMPILIYALLVENAY